MGSPSRITQVAFNFICKNLFANIYFFLPAFGCCMHSKTGRNIVFYIFRLFSSFQQFFIFLILLYPFFLWNEDSLELVDWLTPGIKFDYALTWCKPLEANILNISYQRQRIVSTGGSEKFVCTEHPFGFAFVHIIIES